MKTLTIKDLARNEELDRNAMSNVRGGMPVVAASRDIVTTINQILDALGGTWGRPDRDTR